MFIRNPQWYLVYLYFIFIFFDMFYIQWLCNPLGLLNEKINGIIHLPITTVETTTKAVNMQK